MKLYKGYRDFQAQGGVQNGGCPVLTIGNFDGVHLGHQKLIALALQESKSLGSRAFAYTFNPHPQIALRPEKGAKLLCTYQERVEILSRTGLTGLIEEPFSREFSEMDPRDFFEKIIIQLLGTKVIVVGYDFSFGKNRAGNLELLRSLCGSAGVKLEVVPPYSEHGSVVSSTRIREALASGEIELANRLLGYSFFYRGDVVHGDGRGKKVGIPTANIRLPDAENKKIGLPHGVYATRINGWMGATNIGMRPTFQDATPEVFIESHIFDPGFSGGDLYGKSIDVHFYRKIREEKKFSGIEPLIAQIKQDLLDIGNFFKK